MDDRITLALAEHIYTLDYFMRLPTDLRVYIQTFHVSRLPNAICPRCEKRFYVYTQYGLLGTNTPFDCYECIMSLTRWGMWSYNPNTNLVA